MRYRSTIDKTKQAQARDAQQQNNAKPHQPLSADLQNNIQHIKQSLGHSTDLVARDFNIGPDGKLTLALLYTDGLVDKQVIAGHIESIMYDKASGSLAGKSEAAQTDILKTLRSDVLKSAEMTEIADFDSLYRALLSGECIFLVDGLAQGLAVGARGWLDRGVTEPSSENVVRGPREGFTETLRTNTSLIRRKIKDPNLWVDAKQIGRVTKTDIAIMYIKNIANDGIVKEVHARLDRIDIDGILESGYIEELIQDETFTPFPTLYSTERPDVIAAELLEGKIAIIVDGTPFVLVAPAPFVSFLHSAEDYYQRADISTFIRILRYLGIFISLLAPSFYVAITTFHQEMLPTELLISLAAQRERVPFPALIEAVMMEITFEILREAGIRMPKSIGSAVSIVGTLVIGQAAVEAGIISSVMVIVVSITAISSFVMPAYNVSIAFRMLRFPLMVFAATFGLFGIIVGIIALILHMCSLRTFGIPYMSPLGPLIPSDLKDTIIRLPHWMLTNRPRLLNKKNTRRNKLTPPRKSR